MTPDVMQMIAQFGFPIALAVYLLIRDKSRDKDNKEREVSMSSRLAVLEDKMFTLQQETIAANTAALAGFSGELHKRPCLLEKKEE